MPICYFTAAKCGNKEAQHVHALHSHTNDLYTLNTEQNRSHR